MPALCPLDQHTLEAKKIRHGLYWECPHCHHHSVGLGLLKRAIDPKLVQRFWMQTASGQPTPGEICIHCQEAMHQITHRQDGHIFTLDLCRVCQVLWYQPTQLQQLTETIDFDQIKRPPQPAPTNHVPLIFNTRIDTTTHASGYYAGNFFTILSTLF